MDGKQLDRLIDQFEEMIPKERPQLLTEFHFEQSDWKTIWAKAKEIQQGFNARAHYPTKQLRDRAWQRFNALRDVASKRARQENEQFRATSEMHRSAIFYELKYTRYSRLTDVLFFFDPTTVEEMKAKGRSVRKAKQMLSERKRYMLGEHKSACFELIKEIQESHDLFWEQKRKAHRERKAVGIEDRVGIFDECQGATHRRVFPDSCEAYVALGQGYKVDAGIRIHALDPFEEPVEFVVFAVLFPPEARALVDHHALGW